MPERRNQRFQQHRKPMESRKAKETGLEVMKRLNSLMPERKLFFFPVRKDSNSETDVEQKREQTQSLKREISLKHTLWENRAACWEDTNLWPKGTKD